MMGLRIFFRANYHLIAHDGPPHYVSHICFLVEKCAWTEMASAFFPHVFLLYRVPQLYMDFLCYLTSPLRHTPSPSTPLDRVLYSLLVAAYSPCSRAPDGSVAARRPPPPPPPNLTPRVGVFARRVSLVRGSFVARTVGPAHMSRS